MNHGIIVLSIICILLIIGSIALVYAEHDYFSPYLKWKEVPIICLVDIPREDLYYVIRATDSWKEASDHYTNTTNYTIKVTSTGEMVECDGYLHFSKQFNPNPFTGVVPVGVTDCSSVTIKCSIKIDKSYPGGWYDTVVHEMGHFLGLGHRLSYQNEGIIAVFLSNDVMMPVAKPHVYISKESLDALEFFKQQTTFINYTIPHDDDWQSLK